MATVGRNVQRNCRVKEADVEDGFRVTLYPALMDLELENNNMICAVKEIYTKFVQDKYIKQRIGLCKSTLIGNLVVDISNIVETQIDQARKSKEVMVNELQAKFLEVSKLLDNQVKKIYNNVDPKHINFVENRLQNFVLEYNRKAEEDRLTKCEFHKKKLFQKVYLKLKDTVNPVENQDSAAASNSNSASSGQPVEVKFKSNTKFAGNPVPNLENSVKNGSSVTNPGQSVVLPQPVPVPAPEPELTDDDFKKIVNDTKLSEPEVVEVDGLSAFSYVMHLAPMPDPDQFSFCGDTSTGVVTRKGDKLAVDRVNNRGGACTIG
jgi:hypothetical protein